MVINHGQEKRRAGANKDSTLWPLACQITISLSAYMRDTVDTKAMYRLKVSKECKLLMAV